MQKRNNKYFNYRKNKHCIDCNEIINDKAKRCKICNSKTDKHIKTMLKNFKSNKSIGRLTHGGFLKEYFCKDCRTKISKYAGIYGRGRCGSCAQKRKMKEKLKNPIFKKKLLNSLKKARKYSIKNRKMLINKHHIFLKNIKEFLYLPQGIHQKLHLRAYEFLVENNLIQKYFKWFNKKFNIDLSKYKEKK